jgi:ketosteroid isomerase-like protein
MFQPLKTAAITIAILLAATAAGPLAAHPADAPLSAAQQAIQRDVLDALEALKKAVAAKDVAAVKAHYTEDFTHTHGSGKVDGRDARIVSLLPAEPTVEMAPVEELRVRVHGDATAIVTGRSPIMNMVGATTTSAGCRSTSATARRGGSRSARPLARPTRPNRC